MAPKNAPKPDAVPAKKVGIKGAGQAIANMLDPKPTTTKTLDKAKVADPVRAKPPAKPFSEDDFDDEDGGPPARTLPEIEEEENDDAEEVEEDEEGDGAEEEGGDNASDASGDDEGEGGEGGPAMPAVRCTFDQLRLILSRAVLDQANAHPAGTVVIGTAGEDGTKQFCEQADFDAVPAATFAGTSAGAFATDAHLDLEKVPAQDLPRQSVWVLSGHDVHASFASPAAFAKWCEVEPKPFGKQAVTQHATTDQGVIKVSVGSGWLNQLKLTRHEIIGMGE